MLKKVLSGAWATMFALGAIGFGGNMETAPLAGAEKVITSTKIEAAKTVGNPAKAILAYAQLYAYGDTDADAIKAAGLTQKEIEDIQTQVLGAPIFSFAYFSLTKPNLESIMNQYINNVKASTQIKVTLKTDDPANLVVVLTAKTIDGAAAEKDYETGTEMAKLM